MHIVDCPRRAPLLVTIREDGVVLHDPHTGSTHRLNGVAQDIWQLCDGTRDHAALAHAIATHYGIAPADARRDVDSALTQFRDAGLIDPAIASPAERALLTRAVAAALGAAPAQARADFDGIHWSAVVHLAVDHGVMPLLHQCVATHWHEDVPRLVRERLDGQHAANAAVIDALVTELLDLVGDLAAHDVPALPLKGPVMAQLLYGSMQLRQHGDLDIFVPPRCAGIARDILRRRGYEIRAQRQTDAVAIRQAAAGDIAVDLQWALARSVYRFPLTLDELWTRLVTVDIRGVPVRQPPPDDYLLVLCAHGSKHCWSSLVWIADIVAFLNVFGRVVDWERLCLRAAGGGAQRQLLLGLRLARDVLGANLPPAVTARLGEHPSLDGLVAEIQRTLFAPTEERSFQGSFGLIRGGIFYMKTRERVRDRLPYALHLLQQSAVALVDLVRPNHLDRAVVELPAALGFLYYGVRLVRVSVKWVAWLLKPVTGRR